MTALTLTAERRGELALLMGDEQRLQAEHPKVAEYWNASPTMAGTGDEQADAAFDLRILHYMTGGRSVSANPYWDIVAPSVFEHEGQRVVNGGRPNGSTRLAFAETILQATYAYAIPSAETVDWISRFCAGMPIVEIGAGRGYWAAQLANADLAVDAYDIEPPDKTDNVSFPRAAGQTHVWHPVGTLKEAAAPPALTDLVAPPAAPAAAAPPAPVARAGQVLFLCWPPGWGNSMASNALSSFDAAGGDRLVYIGELKGGKTGDDSFFDALAARWELDSVDSQYVSWWNMNDVAQGWVRR